MIFGSKVVSGLLVAACAWAVLPVIAADAAKAADPEGTTAAAPATCPAPQRIAWRRQLGTPGGDHVKRLATDAGGNVTVFGETAGTIAGTARGGTDVFVAKYSASGQLLWARQYGSRSDDRAVGLAASGDDIAILWSNDRDWTLARINRYGGRVWEKHFPRVHSDGKTEAVADVMFADHRHVVVALERSWWNADGWWYTYVYVDKFTDGGRLAWERQIVEEYPWLAAARLAKDGAGNIIVGGAHMYAYPALTTIAKLDAGGALQWKKTWDVSQISFELIDLAVDRNGDLVLVDLGYWDSADGEWLPLETTRKLGANGEERWARQNNDRIYGDYGWSLKLQHTGVATDACGDVLTSGYAGGDAVISRLSGADGSLMSRRRFGTTADDRATDLVLDRNGNVFVGGITEGAFDGTAAGGGDAFVVKLVP